MYACILKATPLLLKMKWAKYNKKKTYNWSRYKCNSLRWEENEENMCADDKKHKLQ